MTETVNQATQQNGTGTVSQERTFTQAELNAIVADRLSRAQAQYQDYAALKEKAEKYDQAQEAGKTELQKANDQVAKLQAQLDAYTKAENVRSIREKVSKETGVPVNLLYGEDEETCKAQATAIQTYAKPSAPTQVRDGGDHGAQGSGSGSDGVAAAFSRLNPGLKM